MIMPQDGRTDTHRGTSCGAQMKVRGQSPTRTTFQATLNMMNGKHYFNQTIYSARLCLCGMGVGMKRVMTVRFGQLFYW